MVREKGRVKTRKTKAAFSIFGALFLSTAGAFYYEGAPEEAGASEKTYIAEKEAKSLKENNSNEELVNESVESEDKAAVVSDKEATESKDQGTEPKEEVKTNQEMAEFKNTIQYGDSLYVNVMNEPKYQRQAKIAKKYGTELYAVPRTDLFAYFEGKEMVISRSNWAGIGQPAIR